MSLIDCSYESERADGFVFVGNERLPTELGWKRPESAFTIDVLSEKLNAVEDEYHRQLNATKSTKRSAAPASRLLFGRHALLS